MEQVPIDNITQAKLESFIKQEEGDANDYRGWLATFITLAAVGMSLFHLYAAYAIVPTQVLRTVHVGIVLFLVFLSFPFLNRFKNRLMWWDVLLAVGSIVIAYYILSSGDEFADRNTAPNPTDVMYGIALILMILEAVRRTNGLVLVAVTVCFLLYALFGNHLPAPWTHKGYDLDRLVGYMYMTLEGIYGTAVDVSATLIILFTIFGAFLQFTGAGKFFIDFSFAAMGGKSSGVGRTIVLSSFLLGGPSGSGVATTVTVGSVAAPMLEKVGYERNAAGGLLAAGGLGAIISPPVLGAAAFLIADFLKISYLDVLLMASIPTVLFYLGLFVMVEIDVRKYGMKDIHFETAESAWSLAKKYWYHFFSLISIVVFMMYGFSPIMSVFWATVVSAASSMLRRDTAIIPYAWFTGKLPFLSGLYQSNLIKALAAGSTGVLAIAVTCAGAGLIVGTVTLTGLGLKFSTIVIQYAGGSLLLTTIFTALVVWVVGLAVPVTASYIICAVIAAPALINLGVPAFAAHMFIFYYAVLSEVSPPTALSPFAAAAICKGNPYKTTMQTWKYVAPAILVPFMFTLDKSGTALLLMGSMEALSKANWADIAWVSFTAAIGVVCLAGGLQGWFIEKTKWLERTIMVISGVALAYPSTEADLIGFIGFAVVLATQVLRHFRIQRSQIT
ncbi:MULTISPECIES: TRAP transporter fused permease subunit [unclassified Polynucleobacter]|uniref:TRAP transporter permease n=1 Tax=unclassified Polynucleobacter TaxID=2640945 RepID=UPI001F3C3DF8|nr:MULTISPECIES: TRAP transporter fused permease subunit [unclassified Polynucleobacter]MCE7527590.1 TRAP transporter fused permease subunit [Polynucleobacter sp. IMCC 30228]MCE7529408.1 TRAP transporter fused permease subunit [Polynucleobacter sp. IMCC 29146]